MAVTRNQDAELQAINTFMKTNGRQPNMQSEADKAQVYKLAYPPTSGGLPEGLKGTVDESMYNTPASSAINKATVPMSVPAGVTSDIAQKASNLDAARAATEGQFSATNRNEFGRVLQDSLRMASGNTTSGVGLGESEIFKKAGLGGYNVLSQSLQQHAADMQMTAGELSKMVNDMTGMYKAQSADALQKYQTAFDEYKVEADRLSKIAERQENYAQQIKLQQMQDNATRQSTILKYALDNGISQQDATDIIEGNVVPSYTADQIAEAIKQHETGGIARPGATGEISSMYQWLPSTWNTISQQYAQANGLKQSLQPTPENEDKVAKWKIQQLLNQGYNAKDIAMIWNTSLGGAEKPFVRQGVNNGVPYDSTNYAKSVLGILSRSSNIGQSNDMTNLSATNIVQSLFPNIGTAKEREPLVKKVEKMLSEGKNISDIRDEINKQIYPGEMIGDWMDAVNNVSKSLSQKERDNYKQLISNYIVNGDTESAKEQLKSMAYNNLTSIQKEQVSGMQLTLDFAKSIRDDLKAYEDAGGKTNIIKGKIEDIYKLTGNIKDPALRVIAARIAINLQQYRRSMTGVAFSPQESKEYAKIFPSIDNVGELNSTLLDAMEKDFNTKLDGTYKREIGATQYDKLFNNKTTDNNTNNNDPLGLR